MDLSYDIFLKFLYENAPINIDKVKYNEFDTPKIFLTVPWKMP